MQSAWRSSRHKQPAEPFGRGATADAVAEVSGCHAHSTLVAEAQAPAGPEQDRTWGILAHHTHRPCRPHPRRARSPGRRRRSSSIGGLVSCGDCIPTLKQELLQSPFFLFVGQFPSIWVECEGADENVGSFQPDFASVLRSSHDSRAPETSCEHPGLLLKLYGVGVQ